MRLDLKVAEQFQLSRSSASDYIKRGLVRVNEYVITKPAYDVNSDDIITLNVTTTYVSRGGEKLDSLIAKLPFSLSGLHGLDIGSSTGGFTQCLLKHGVESMVCVDVGRDQLHPSLRQHPKITLYEETSILDLHKFVNQSFDIIVMDVSFTSIMNVIHALNAFTHSATWLIVLFKPQFEVGVKYLNKSGVVKNKAVIEATLSKRIHSITDFGYRLHSVVDSAIKGKEGNQETFLVFQKTEGL